jgi:hypothetical protein
VINPSSTSSTDTVSVSTSSDNATSVASNTYAVTAAQSVSNVTVSQGISSATSARASYTVNFKTSNTGGMAAGQADTVTLVFPAGTGLNSQTSSAITDTTTNTQVGNCSNTATTTVTCSIFFTNAVVTAGDNLSVVVNGVINPSTAAASDTVSVKTSSDNATSVPSSNTFAVTTAQSVSGVQASVSSTSPSATGVTYTIGFKTSSTGGMAAGQADTITLSFPAGTGLNNQTSSSITDTTTNSQVGNCSNTATTTVTCSIFFTNAVVTAGDNLSVVINGVSNPSTTSNTDTASVKTSSDNASAVASNAYFAGGGGSAPTVTSVSPSSGPAAGGTSVTITGTNFTTGASVAFGPNAASNVVVTSGTQITATSPPGSGTVDITVTTPSGISATTPADQFTYSAAPPPPPPPVSPVVSAGAPTVQSTTTAAFSGSVNPEGLPTTASFQYGLDPKYSGGGPISYSSSTTAQQVGSDFSAHPVSAQVSGLVPNALYHVRLVATNSAGTTLGPDQTFTTPPDPPPPPPVLGQSVDVKPVSGLVLVKLPGQAARDASGAHLRAHAGLAKGVGFIPLTEARQLPTGTQVDARAGKIQLSAAAATKHGKLQNGTFNGGLFKLSQDRGGLTKGLTTLSLLEGAFTGAPTYASCKKKALDPASPSAFAALSSSVLQTLRSSAHGKFRTRGRYAAAVVRGTAWTMSDRCDGTLVTVQRDTVAVQDFVRHVTVLVRQGHRYLAKAPSKRH